MLIKVPLARVVALAVFGALAAGCFALVAAYVIDLRIPVLWGRYTASRSECSGTGRFTQCMLTGDWVSADGSKAVTGLTLNRRFAPTGSVAAGYRDGGILDGQGLVVAGSATGMSPAPWIALAAGTVCGVTFYRTLRRE